jgi:hypothetical protein
MCYVQAIIAVAGLAMQAYSGHQQAVAQKQAANYQAQVDNNNATLADYKAETVARIGSIQEDRQRAKVRQMIGTQRAALAGNGLDLSEGTPLDLVTETAATGTEDALNIRYNAMREAWGYRQEATDLRSSAKFKKVSGINQANATYLTTGANVLNSAYNLKYG